MTSPHGPNETAHRSGARAHACVCARACVTPTRHDRKAARCEEVECPPSLRRVAAMWSVTPWVAATHLRLGGLRVVGPRCCVSWLACRLSSLTSRHAPPQPPAPGGALRHGSTADRQRSQSGRAESALAIRAARARARGRSFSSGRARGRLLPRARTSRILTTDSGHSYFLDLSGAAGAPCITCHLRGNEAAGEERRSVARVWELCCVHGGRAAHRPRPRIVSAASAATR